jgi:branched-chain amino acid transport system permease protein
MDLLTLLLQQVVNGIAVGSVYALVAIGLSLIWATGRLLDFAFGEIFMLGGVLAWTLTVSMGGAIVPSIIAGLPICFMIGVLLQRTLYRRLSDEDHVIVLAATIGVSMILKDGATKIWGSETLIFPVLFGDVWFVGDIAIRAHFVFITAVAALLIGLFHVVIVKTRVGMAMRAVAENRSVAGMMGVNVQAMLAIAFGLSYLLAAAAGALIGPVHYVQTTGGTAMMIKGVTAAVLGGFGSLPGAFVGGLLIGQVEALSAGFISSAFKDVIVFATFIVVLFIRPEGILGEKRQGVSAL